MITKWPAGFNKEKALLGAYSVRYSRRFVDSSSWDESIVVSVSGRGHWSLSPLSYRHICTTAHCPAQHDHLTTTSRLSGVRSLHWTRETAGPSGAGCGTHLFLFSSKRLCCIVHVPPIRMFTIHLWRPSLQGREVKLHLVNWVWCDHLPMGETWICGDCLGYRCWWHSVHTELADSSARDPNSGLFIQSPRILAFPSITVWGYDYILTIIFIPQFREVIPAQLVESRSARLQRLCSMTMRNNAYFTVWRLEPTDGSAPGGWAYYDHYRTKLTA